MSLLLNVVVIGGCSVSLLAVRRRMLSRVEPLRRWQLVFAHVGGDLESGHRLLAQVNPKYAKMLGYREDELRGETVDVFLPPGLRKGYAEFFDSPQPAGCYCYAVLLRHRDGHLFPVVISISVCYAVDGEMCCQLDDLLALDEIESNRNRLEVAENFFWKVFDATPVGMVMVANDGCYTRVNRAMCEFTGYAESELLGKNYRDITHPDDDSQRRWLSQAAIDPRSPTFQLEKRYLRKDGEVLWAMLVALPVFDGDGKLSHWLGQVIDIDALKRAEGALRISEQRFRGVFENANTGMVVADQGGRVAYFNEAFRLMLGHDAEALMRMHFADFFVPPERISENTLTDEILKTSGDKSRIERRWTARDGRQIWVDLYISTIRDESGAVVNFIAVVGDITERKKSELALGDSKRKLRALAAYQEGLLEQERKHIAGEVHDEMGQLMTALKMDLSLMRLRFGENVLLLGMVDEMRSLVDRTINVVRQVASNLRPAVLDHGLAPAIEWLAADFSRRGSIRCRLDASGTFELPELQSTAVFRVVQESLTNVTRHSQAREVVISMHCSGQQLQVVVHDDGVGFDTTVVGKGRGFGLFGMRERLLALGGRLRIASAPGQGTAVTITLPLLNGDCS